MSDETTPFVLGDCAVDAATEGRRGLLRRRRKQRDERTLTHCENCGEPLAGPYCAKCGQHAIDYRRSLWRVLIDAADSFLNWDTKFLATILVLLGRPWKLTNDFNAGRRARYVHPLRLYLLASIAFFLMTKLVNIENTGPLVFRPQDRAEIASALAKLTGPDSMLPAEQQAKLEAARTRIAAADGFLSEQERKELRDVVKNALTTPMKAKFESGERARLKAALKRLPEAPPPPPPPGTMPTTLPDGSVVQPKMPMSPTIHFGPNEEDGKPNTPFESWLQRRIKDKIGTDGTKGKLFLETLRNNIPTMMLCCVPLFAVVLKILYLRRRRYYVEHLVYALHIHTFVYVGVVVITAISMSIAQVSGTARALFTVALSIAMFVQVFLSIRRVYGQGWFATTMKFIMGGLAYSVILVLAVGVTALVTLLLPS